MVFQGASSPFYEMDIKVPLRQQLANRVILEYPVIYVFLPSHTIDFEVIKDACPAVHKSDIRTTGSNNNHLSPKGVPFKEEEIMEEDSSSAPQVFDLMKHETSANLAFPHEFAHRSRSDKVSNNSSEQAALSAGVAAGSGLQLCSSNNNEKLLFEDMDFDFDQGLIDAYSDLIAESNPDDFLDLEHLLNEEEETEDRKTLSYAREDFIAEDDLEEGEIVE